MKDDLVNVAKLRVHLQGGRESPRQLQPMSLLRNGGSLAGGLRWMGSGVVSFERFLALVLSWKPKINIRGMAKNNPARQREATMMMAATDELSCPFALANAMLACT